MFKFQKKKIAKNDQKEIYILNSAEDVLKIPEDTFYKIDISNFSGNYFRKIYEEALEVEQGKRKLKKARQLNFNFELLDEINLDYFKNLGEKEKIEKKEYNETKKEKKEKIVKKEKEVKNENKKYIKKESKEYKIKKEDKKEGSDKTPTKPLKYINRIKQIKKLNYDSPINHIKNKSYINYNETHNINQDKSENQLNFDSLNAMRQRNMNDTNNNIKSDNDDNYLLKNVLEMMRNRQRIKSEEKNRKLKKHRFEPLEIIFEDNSRKKRVISPEINIKRNFNTKFNKILYNLYNIKSKVSNDNINNHSSSLNEENKNSNNQTEKSISTMFNEIKKNQKRKYYVSLLKKKINYLKQISFHNKFNKTNIDINAKDNNNQININSNNNYNSNIINAKNDKNCNNNNGNIIEKNNYHSNNIINDKKKNNQSNNINVKKYNNSNNKNNKKSNLNDNNINMKNNNNDNGDNINMENNNISNNINAKNNNENIMNMKTCNDINNNEKYINNYQNYKAYYLNNDNNENFNNNFQNYNNPYYSNNNNNFFNSYNQRNSNFSDKNEINDESSNSTINKNNTNKTHKIKKIIFNYKYNSNYGDIIGILGSNEQLGKWCQDKILYLKWNYGNIWSSYIIVDNAKLENFEFKYIISHEGTIYWEKGYNYLVDFEGLIDEIQYHKKGRFNKYEYAYVKENSELILHCKWNRWEWDDNNNSN